MTRDEASEILLRHGIPHMTVYGSADLINVCGSVVASRLAELEREKDEAQEYGERCKDRLDGDTREIRLRAEAAEVEVERLRAVVKKACRLLPHEPNHDRPEERAFRAALANLSAALNEPEGA